MPRNPVVRALLLTLALLWLGASAGSVAHAAPVLPLEGYADVNGVRLSYLDWGGTGPALILIPGLGASPHSFDDLAPAFSDRFHVFSYARRGSGNSTVKGPYDLVTETEDLRDLMDALHIAKADLIGLSAGGGEITEFAAAHPDRVDRIVYLEGGYDWSDPDFKTAVKALPQGFFNPPASAMASLDAFREYMRTTQFNELDDMSRVEADLRDKVTIQSDGTLKYRLSPELVSTLYNSLFTNKPRDYKGVRCPALAIYAEHLYDLPVSDTQRRDTLVAFEHKYWRPFQEKQIDLIRKELPNVEIAHLPGAHGNFMLLDHQQVVELTDHFLGVTAQASAKATR